MKRLTADQARELMNEELSQARFEEIMDDIYYKIAEMAKKGWHSMFTDQARYSQVKKALIEDGYTVHYNENPEIADYKYTISWSEN